MAISGSSGSNVNPEKQRTNINKLGVIINNIEKEIIELEDSLTRLSTLGMNGECVLSFIKNYSVNREVINTDVKNIATLYMNLGTNLNDNLKANEAFTTK